MATNILPSIPKGTETNAIASAIVSSSNVPTEEIEGEEGGGDFLSLILSNLSKKGGAEEKGTSLLPDIANITVETLEVTATSISFEGDLPDNMLLEEATFVQILEILEKFSGEGKLKKLPTLDSKLNNLLKEANVVEEFKGAKSIEDILKLSKKFELGLEKISITSKDIKDMKKSFPNLDKKNFFEVKKINILSADILKPMKKAEKSEAPITLSSLIKDLKEPKKQKTSKVKLPEIDDGQENVKIKNKKEVKEEKVLKEDKKTVSLPTKDKAPTQNAQKTNTINTNTTSNAEQKAPNLNEALNKNENKEEKVEAKTEAKTESKNESTTATKETAKPNNLNVKPNTVKHTLNTFAQDFKEKVEQYKPPLMKVQLALNPKNLGEMEVTLVNRGSNLHVNITSNTNAMNVFVQNQAEFKNSLVNMGFTNLEMNFQDKSKEGQKQNGSKNAYSNNADEDEEFATEDTVLEMVLPNYV